MADKKNAVAELFEQGKTSGKLTTQEINDAIEDLDYDVDQVEELYESQNFSLARRSALFF